MPPREGLEYGNHLPHRWASSELVQGRRGHGRGDKDAIVPMDMIATASNGHGALKAGARTCLFGLCAARDHICELQRAAGGWVEEGCGVAKGCPNYHRVNACLLGFALPTQFATSWCNF